MSAANDKSWPAIRTTHRLLLARHPEIHTLSAPDQLRVLRAFVTNMEEKADENPTE